MAFNKTLVAAVVAGMVATGASSADAQSTLQNNQKNQQHPVPAKPAVVVPRQPQVGTTRLAPTGVRPQFGAIPGTGAGTRVVTPQYRRVIPGSTTAGTRPGGATPTVPGSITPRFTSVTPHGHTTVPGPGTAVSITHPHGGAAGWRGGNDVRVFHAGAPAGVGAGRHFGAGATFAVGAGAGAGVAAGFRATPHWHEFLRGGSPAFDAAQAISFEHAHEHDFHVSDVRFFTAEELVIWRHGIWHDGWHYGHWGWWWVVGDVWYPYPAPIYPYPVVVAPLIVQNAIFVPGAPVGSAPPPAAMAGAPPPAALSTEIPPLPAPPLVSYQCNNPEGAFPDVGACTQQWTATPLAATAMQ